MMMLKWTVQHGQLIFFLLSHTYLEVRNDIENSSNYDIGFETKSDFIQRQGDKVDKIRQ